MADPETARLLSSIHRTLELIAFLLAVLLIGTGGVGVMVGGIAAILLAVESLSGYLG